MIVDIGKYYSHDFTVAEIVIGLKLFRKMSVSLKKDKKDMKKCTKMYKKI